MTKTLFDAVAPSPAQSRGGRTLGRWVAVALLATTAGCSDVGLSTGVPQPGTETHPGFDTSIYPGDVAMRTWRTSSPYEWTGFYLPAPCHRDVTWSGKRATLDAQGWGFGVLYVGQQDFGAALQRILAAEVGAQTVPTCSASLLTAARGAADANDAIARAQAEGFANGTVIFLDVEPVTAVSAALDAYYRAWIARVLADGRYAPGVYCHRTNATTLFNTARDVYARSGRGGTPRFWVSSTLNFDLTRPPTDSGFSFASVWQGRLDTTETYGGVSIDIDADVASTASPST
jgi:hypothetical protein